MRPPKSTRHWEEKNKNRSFCLNYRTVAASALPCTESLHDLDLGALPRPLCLTNASFFDERYR